MDQEQNLDELLSCRLEFGRKAVEPCTIVIFGASGDLTARKLIPAKTLLLPVEGAGHDLGFKGKAKRDELPQSIVARFLDFFVQGTGPSGG